ncbi:MFS transporter [Bailinhaonella thermotolerans]|uniref:MFS transporter n=1 Tax=Bailinhaonella thermotolerans TaxID=1070861 RepID=A0A3A4AND5_9ACTN|nr:MFS transporter [Bailinhaonella thermotolerans]RJL27130.1 MFS transporter [Bailinhaonella thermotolerans]
MTLTENRPAITPPHPRRWLGLAVLSASLLLVVMDITILNVALPAIAAELRPDSVSLLWMVDVYALVVAGLLVTVSALADRWGRRRMLLTGFAVFGAASAAVVWADSPGEVIALRALLGVGGAMIMPSTLSLIRTLFPDGRERATALGVWAAMAAVGGALGPILGGLLLEHFSWHAAFLVNVPVMAVAIAAGLVLLPESRNPRPGRLDLLAALLSMAGMTALIFAIKQVGKHGVTDPAALAALAVAAAALGWFAARCLRRPEPLLELRLFRTPSFTAGAVTALITELAMAGVMLLMAQWMQLVKGYGPLETGLRLLPLALAAVVASPLAPALAARIGARTVLAGGLAVTAGGFLVLAAAPLEYPVVVASLALIGLGMGSLSIASAAIMAGAPPEKAGSAAAIEETGYELGGALGVAILGSLAAAVYRAALPLGTLAALGVTGAAAGSARESLAGALELPVPALAARAQAAFTDSLALTGLAGGALMLAAAAAVWFLTPRTLDLSAASH